jgi:hypothetical protein
LEWFLSPGVILCPLAPLKINHPAARRLPGLLDALFGGGLD